MAKTVAKSRKDNFFTTMKSNPELLKGKTPQEAYEAMRREATRKGLTPKSDNADKAQYMPAVERRLKQKNAPKKAEVSFRNEAKKVYKRVKPVGDNVIRDILIPKTYQKGVYDIAKSAISGKNNTKKNFVKEETIRRNLKKRRGLQE